MAKETKIKEDTVTVPVAQGDLDAVSNAEFYNPHGVLGGHLGIGKHADTATIRVLRPLAKSVTILTQDGEYPMTHEYNGVFVTTVPASGTKKQPTIPDYRVRTEWESGAVLIEDDPYRYMPTVGDMDTYLFGEGRHEKLWEALGAHVLRYDDPMGGVDGTPGEQVVGTAFSVWAPNAHAVRVVGNFNAWDGRRHAMRELGSSGVWEIFIPGIGAGETYKFQILNANYTWEMKADPMERQHEVPPNTASIVTESTYEWNDDAWMQHRRTTNPHDGPVSIYEVHAGSWKQGLTYRDLAKQLVDYVKQEGFTHVEFMPLAQHPFSGSWGYQVTGYYAVDSRLGSPDDFRYLVDQFHQAGIGVIMDWVPAHFPKDAFALGRFDGTPLYEDPDPLRGEHPEWGTYVFNFGRREVRNFLVANALFWLEDLHVDALRVDAVSSMLYLDYSREPGHWRPNIYGGRENLEAIDFLKEATATAYKNNPGVMMIAEESTAWPGITAPTSAGGIGFGLKWNMGWMHDTLEYLHEDAHQPQVAPQRNHLLHGVRLLRALRTAHQPRRSRVRQGLPVRQDAGRWLAEAGRRAFDVRLSVGSPGQEALLHGQRARPVGRVGSRRLHRLGLPELAGAPSGPDHGRRPQRLLQGASGTMEPGLRSGRLPVADQRRCRPQHAELPAHRHQGRDLGRGGQLLR